MLVQYSKYINATFSDSKTSSLHAVAAKRDTIAPNSGDALKLETRVRQIQAGDPLAAQELYEMINIGSRFILKRHLPFSEVGDRVHRTFIIVFQAIQNNELRESARLLGYIRTVAYHQISSYINESVKARQRL